MTNKLNLPQAFINFINNNERHEYDPNKFSVTELLKPVKDIVLSRIHRNEIEEDISECIPALFGTAVHKVMEECHPTTDSSLAESEFAKDILGVTLTGIIDVLDADKELIEDYKTTSVSKVMKQDFDDWRKQGLMYAWLCYPIRVKRLRFYALMKDWSKIKAATSVNYPQSPIYIYEYSVQDSDYDYIEQFIRDKLKSVLNSLKTSELPDCSSEDKWYSGTTYAVYKNEGDKRAFAVKDNEYDAQSVINELGKGVMVARLGENLKCKYYCKCNEWCEQYKKEVNDGNC